MSQRLIGGLKSRRTWKLPFHVRQKHVAGKHVGYDIMVNNHPFLLSADSRFPLKRHEAYAICRLLNSQRRSLKWAAKFGDPYV